MHGLSGEEPRLGAAVGTVRIVRGRDDGRFVGPETPDPPQGCPNRCGLSRKQFCLRGTTMAGAFGCCSWKRIPGFHGRRLPIGASNRRLLNQSTHSKGENSTASALRRGPCRWVISALNRAMIVSPSALWQLSPIIADREFNAALGPALGAADRDLSHGLSL